MTPPSAETISEAGEAIEPWPFYGYAPGGYMIKCVDCGGSSKGGADKRAMRCLPCAVIASKQDALTARVAVAPEAADPAVEVTRERLLAAEGNRLRDKCKGMAQEYGAYEAFTGWLFDNSGTLLAALARSVGPDLRGMVEKAQKALKPFIRDGYGAGSDCYRVHVTNTHLQISRAIADEITRALGEAR